MADFAEDTQRRRQEQLMPACGTGRGRSSRTANLGERRSSEPRHSSTFRRNQYVEEEEDDEEGEEEVEEEAEEDEEEDNEDDLLGPPSISLGGSLRANDTFTPGGEPDPYDADKKYVYIKDLRLFINGNCPDQFQGGGDSFEAPLDFMRLQEVQGLYGKNATNSINPTLFNRNCYIAAWNLSCTPNPSTYGIQPTVGATHSLVLRCTFSAPIPHDLQLIVWSQLSSAMTIDNTKRVGLSYYNVYNK